MHNVDGNLGEVKSFTLRLSADVLKMLTAKEQRLWTALRYIADAKTGELRFKDHWFDATRFDREAQMCTRTRKDVMRSLVSKGLAHMEPVYVLKELTDHLTGHRRNRKVRAGFHYFVAEFPRQDWLSTKVQDKKQQKHKGSTKVQSLHRARNAPSNSFSDPKSKAQVPHSHSETEKETQLRKWATEIILARAKDVRCKPAFLKTSLEQFFQDLPAEVESYLTEKLERYVDSCLWDCPHSPVGFRELTNYLEFLCDEHDLPIDPADSTLTDRIFASVEQFLGDSLMKNEAEQDDSCGYVASEKFRALRYKEAERSPIRGWQPDRTLICGYHLLPPAPETGAGPRRVN